MVERAHIIFSHNDSRESGQGIGHRGAAAPAISLAPPLPLIIRTYYPVYPRHAGEQYVTSATAVSK